MAQADHPVGRGKVRGITGYSMPSTLATATSAPSASTETASVSQSRKKGGRASSFGGSFSPEELEDPEASGR